ncbi:GntR family transcriptional regulator [Halomonas sp. HNIBRBA4712]|uniref:GntR family transcriptional regulator n=1 Tax=Halomonas sp. HNIBRBA4712 TaxID=3373087 RepID=UPI00374524F8
MKTNELQVKIAQEIIALARRERYAAHQRLVTTALAEELGVSRSPVKSALSILEELGAVQYDKNRGFFLACAAEELTATLKLLDGNADDDLYQRIAEFHLDGKLAADVNEAEMMRLLGVSRNQLRKCLSRIQQEGWVERNAGHGWHFMPVVDSVEAYEESYYFRIVNEPAAILGPSFEPHREELSSLIAEQEFIASQGYSYMTAQELFDANTRFHETVASWSGNRFILQSLKRLNQLRRLVEYRQVDKRASRKGQSAEHLDILYAIQRMDGLEAASLMRKHLEGARRTKVYDSALFKRTSDVRLNSDA